MGDSIGQERGGATPLVIVLIALTALVVVAMGSVFGVDVGDLATETDPTPTTTTAPVESPSRVSVHGSMTVIRPDRTTPPGKSKAMLVAARNEFESFQVAVEGGRGRDGVRVSLGGELTGPGGATIPGANVTLYREAAYHVAFASDREGEAGDWYDALIPEVDPYYGEDRRAFPVDIPADGKLVVWVDILVPRSAPAGLYRGDLLVTQDGGDSTLATIPIRVTVLDYTMPSTSSLRSLFLSTNEYVPKEPCLAHDGVACGADSERGWLLHYLYSRAGLENRVTVANPSPVRTPDFADPKQTELFHRFVDPLLDGVATDLPGIGLQEPRLRGARLTTMWAGLGEDCFGACLDGWERLLGSRRFASRFVYYACDEPGDAEDWAECASRAASAGADVPVLITATIAEAVLAGATGYIDVLVPNVNAIAPEGVGDTRALYDDYLSVPGRELWLYTSCESHGCGPDETCAEPESPTSDTDGWPGYMIDQPASQARAMGWIADEYDATGELYYSATWSLETAWTDQCVFGGNGEGNLFYPGRPEGYDGSKDSVIGGRTDIPIESLRLKRIRDGREDYEYLRELEARGRGARAQAIAEHLLGAPDVAARGATFSQANLDAARCELAELLDPSLGRCP